MGLDIYLYRCPDRKLARFNEKEYEKATEGIGERLRKQMFGSTDWAAFDKAEQSVKDQFWQLYKSEKEPFAARFGIDDERSSHVTDEKIEMDSALYPKHYWKIGYLRSSYNDGGFNSYARRIGIPDLGELLGNEEGEYEFSPDWSATKKRALAALATLREKDFDFDVESVKPNIFSGVPTFRDENSVLEAFRKQHKQWADRKENDGFEAYSNSDGIFWTKGISIYAAVPGIETMLGRDLPCTYLVVKHDGANWYAEALEILVENCNWVLEQPNREQLYLHWSG